ncbi:Transcription factor COE3, partial [Ophiophagus hannah]
MHLLNQRKTLSQSPLQLQETCNNGIGLARAHFEKQPPSNLRKSNFFHFVLAMYDRHGQPVEIERTSFIDFVEKDRVRSKLMPGFCKCLPKHTHNIHTQEIVRIEYPPTLPVAVISIFFPQQNRMERKPTTAFTTGCSCCTVMAIIYEGQDKNPEMCRVLLTHEIMCSRCCDKKSCGNRNETPSDPVIIDRKGGRKGGSKDRRRDVGKEGGMEGKEGGREKGEGGRKEGEGRREGRRKRGGREGGKGRKREMRKEGGMEEGNGEQEGKMEEGRKNQREIFSQVLPQMQPELLEECRQSTRYAPVPGGGVNDGECRWSRPCRVRQHVCPQQFQTRTPGAAIRGGGEEKQKEEEKKKGYRRRRRRRLKASPPTLTTLFSPSQLITPHAIRVQTPPRHIPGVVEVTLSYKSKQFCKGAPGRFVYTGKRRA